MGILSIYKITKQFPRKRVLDQVSLTFETGRMYALLGENGAGKSTLASVLMGTVKPESGKILLDGVEIKDNLGEICHIAAVNQIPELVNSISVLDNCILGAEPVLKGGIISRRSARTELEVLCRKWGTGPVLDKKTYSLTAQERFFCALLSALYRKPHFLILDEPSATLSKDERTSLFERLSAAARDGLCVIFITHDIKEAVSYADSIYVLRDGSLSASFETSSFRDFNFQNIEEKIYSSMFHLPAATGGSSAVGQRSFLAEGAAETSPKSMISQSSPAGKEGEAGKSAAALASRRAREPSYEANSPSGTYAACDDILRLEGVSASPYRKAAVRKISFDVKPASITCIMGQKEAGLETLEDIVTGMNDFPISGRIVYMGKMVRSLTPSLLRSRGTGIVPSDKTHRASFPQLSVRDILTSHYGKENELIKLSGVDILPEEPVTNLSGGMLQSLVIERELFLKGRAGQPRLLIFANPVYGLDKKRTAAIIERIQKEARRGAAVLVLAAEGSEIEKHADYSYRLVSGVLEPLPADKTAGQREQSTLQSEDSPSPEVSPKTEEVPAKLTAKKKLLFHPHLALLAGFAAAALLILFMAKNPWNTLLSFFTAPLSSSYFLGNWFNTATLLLTAAIGAYASITAGSINLGGEGQVYASGFVAALFLGALPDLSAAAAIPLLIFAAVLSASAATVMTALPAVLKNKKNIEVLLSSFLLSGAVIPCIDSAITKVFRAKEGNLLATPFLKECFRLPQLLKPSSLNISVIFVLMAAVVLLYLLLRSRKGRIFRICGSAPVFSKLSGFKVKENFMTGMVLSGAFHGLCGFFAVTGTHYTCHSGFYSGFGWNALTAALIAGKNPLMLLPSVLVLSFIYTGCEKTVLTGSMNPDMTFIIQAVILLFVTVQKHATRRAS
ncbi:MAG: ATP-binding cassette domain-containing protein [Treponemataceae bacterium]|nr:ATP-binding cassette domain-containing protein [Treponemataceae bacterium]